jgi:hypothetical protein
MYSVTEYIGQYDLDSNGITRPRIHVDVRRVHAYTLRGPHVPACWCARSRLMEATPRTPSSLQSLGRRWRTWSCLGIEFQSGIANASQKESEVGESRRAIAGDRSGNRRRRKSPPKSRGRRGRKVVGQKGPRPAAASPGRCRGSCAGVVSACLSLSLALSLSPSLRQAGTLLQAGACSSRAGSCGEGVFNELFGKRRTGGG